MLLAGAYCTDRVSAVIHASYEGCPLHFSKRPAPCMTPWTGFKGKLSKSVHWAQTPRVSLARTRLPCGYGMQGESSRPWAQRAGGHAS